METRESRRAQELRDRLADRFGLPKETVSEALLAVASAIHERLPRGVRVAFLSWIPESWTLLSARIAPATEILSRGPGALKNKVVAAGVPDGEALLFVAEMVQFLGARCGRPLAEALSRKVPEIADVRVDVEAHLGEPVSTA